MKKLLATILALVMALSLCTVAFAAGENCTAANCQHVAAIGDTHYDTLAEAVNNAKDGKVIVLLKDIDNQDTISINNGAKVVIDLGGRTLTFKPNKMLMIEGGNLDLRGSGTVKSSQSGRDYLSTIYLYGNSTQDVAEYSVVTIGKDVVIENEGSYGLGVGHKANNVAYGAKLVLNGSVKATYGFTVNGQIKATSGNIPEITISETGSIESTTANDSGALYAAGYAKYNVAGTLIGVETGVEIRAGILNISDTANITATGPFNDPAPNGNGSTTKGVAVAVSQHTTNLPITVNIYGGTIKATGTNGKSLYEIDTVNEVDEENVAKDVQVNVFGGNFQQEVYSTNKKVSISGGTFSNSVKGYVVSGLNYEAVNGGEYTYHGDINSAVAAAGANGKIKNLKETPAQGSNYDVILKDGDTVVTTLRTSAASVNLPTLSKSGYTFKGWKDNGGKVHTGTFTLPSQAVTDNFYLTAVWSANSYYYYHPTTDTKTDTTKGSPKTFDAGAGIYAVTALLSVTGMAWAGKKRH
mgnify:FL=1